MNDLDKVNDLDSKGHDLEALLILENIPFSSNELQKLLSLDEKTLDRLVERKNRSYENAQSLLRIIKKANKYEMFMETSYQSPNIIGYLHKKRKLPHSIIETLSVIAYKQPITRSEIEDIRGVNCSHQIKSLLDEGLISAEGRKDTVGRPILFKTTNQFLNHFGIKSLKDLPPLEEIKTYAFLDESN